MHRPGSVVLATCLLAAGVVAPLAISVPSGQAAAAASTAPCPAGSSRSWCDRTLSADRRATLFEKAMIQDEKIQLLGGDSGHASPHTGATYAVPRLGLRAVYFSDGPVGPRQGSATAMPIPMALAATWDPDLAFQHGATIANEAKHKGNDVVFAPTVNIMRTPQGGRTYEAYGEEPFLVARTAVQWIRGAQSQGVIADVKHFAANNQEGLWGVPPVTGVLGARMLVDARVSERALREVYFPAFEASVKQGDVGTIMCSYNRINGAFGCENHHNLVRVLEHDWNFRGFVISDYGASKDTVGNLNNGLDFVPNEGQTDMSYDPTLIKATLASGSVTMATVNAHVHRILRTLFAYGVFDRPAYANKDAAIDFSGHGHTARTIEEHAITLLKNNGVLPLHKGVSRIAVIGPYADQFVTGGGSGSVTPHDVVTALQGIQDRAGHSVSVTYADGSDQAAAAAAAAAADVAIVVVGDVETEGQDKSCVALNCSDDLVDSEAVLASRGETCGQATCPINGTDENGLISKVAAAQRKTVVVLETGAPVLTPWRSKVAALLEAWYPGDRGGAALAHVLWGDVDPGGRLPVTFPAAASQLPTAGSAEKYPGVAETEYYREGVFVGYRWYDSHHFRPAYPFGAGLSYTKFRYGPLHVTAAHGDNRVAIASLVITNIGNRAGTAVPQLYIGKPSSARHKQPVRELAGFTSVHLRAGFSAQVQFPLNNRSFATWSNSGWRVPSGCYQLSSGASSRALSGHAVIARASGCAHAALRLGTSGSVRLPLPAQAAITR